MTCEREVHRRPLQRSGGVARRATGGAGRRATAGRRRPRVAVLVSMLAASALAGCQAGLPSTTGDLSTGQALLDIAQTMNDLRDQNATIQAELDSLRSAVAYQDTVLRQLAALSGVSVRPQAVLTPQ